MEDVDYRLEVISSKSGKMTLRIKVKDEPYRAFHSLYDPEAEALMLVEAFHFDGRGILVVLGLGLGYHVWALAEKFPDAPIVVVEAFPEIDQYFRSHGKVPVSRKEITSLIALPISEVIEKIAKIQEQAGKIPISVFSLIPAVSSVREYYTPLLSLLKGRIVSKERWDRLKYLKFQSQCLKIAIMDVGLFISRELETAARRLGHLVRVVTTEENGEESADRWVDRVLDFQPDFVLTVNNYGLDRQGILTAFFKSIEMPMASWHVDNPNLILQGRFEKNITPYIALFLWDKSYIKALCARGFGSVVYLPLATDETVFKPIPLSPSDMGKYHADVGFVGESLVVQTAERMKAVPQENHPLVEEMARRMAESRKPFHEVLAEMGDHEEVRGLSAEGSFFLEAASLWKATLLYRLACIRTLEPFCPTIHGDEEWRGLLVPPMGPLSAPYRPPYQIEGRLNYYRELPLFYNGCKVNLNATNLQMPEAVNQRVFDVPACAAFLLTDYQKDIEGLFEINKEIVVYQDRTELPDLVRFYLHHTTERDRISKFGRARVLKEHTYPHRLGAIIETMTHLYK